MNTGILLKHPAISIPLSAQAAEMSCKFQQITLQKVLKYSPKPLDHLALNQAKPAAIKSSSMPCIASWLLVLAIHSVALYLITYQQAVPEVLLKTTIPITVSIITPSKAELEPEPEIVPIVKPVEVIKKSLVEPKKVVEIILPVENPTQPVFEETTDLVEQKIASLEELAAPAVVKETTKSAPDEEKIELPKFGVAYLNNPAPEYPRMAKRAGEEGRVLLKVLVSADGLAETVHLEKSSGSERLDRAATNAVSRWKFVPARKGGQTISAYAIVPINFSLDD